MCDRRVPEEDEPFLRDHTLRDIHHLEQHQSAHTNDKVPELTTTLSQEPATMDHDLDHQSEWHNRAIEPGYAGNWNTTEESKRFASSFDQTGSPQMTRAIGKGKSPCQAVVIKGPVEDDLDNPSNAWWWHHRLMWTLVLGNICLKVHTLSDSGTEHTLIQKSLALALGLRQIPLLRKFKDFWIEGIGGYVEVITKYVELDIECPEIGQPRVSVAALVVDVEQVHGLLLGCSFLSKARAGSKIWAKIESNEEVPLEARSPLPRDYTVHALVSRRGKAAETRDRAAYQQRASERKASLDEVKRLKQKKMGKDDPHKETTDGENLSDTMVDGEVSTISTADMLSDDSWSRVSTWGDSVSITTGSDLTAATTLTTISSDSKATMAGTEN